MPGFNGAGPQGQGAGTGGRRGPCFAGTGAAAGSGGQRGAGRGYAPRGGGRGRAFGGGRGPEFGFRAQPDAGVEALKNRAAVLERELEDLRRLIGDHRVKQG